MQTIILTFDNGNKMEFIKGIKLRDVINTVKSNYNFDIIYAKFNNRIINSDYVINKSGNLSLYDINTKEGNKAYERGLLCIFTIAAHLVLGKETKIIVKNSIDKGVFCAIDKEVTEEDIINIKKTMKGFTNDSIPFTKMETTKGEALDYFRSIGREDKVKTLFYNNSAYISLYLLGNHYNYIIGNLPENTSVLKYFDLSLIKNKGIVVRFPTIYDNGKITKYKHHENYFNSLEEYNTWGKNINITTAGELNEFISGNNSTDIIQLSEIMQNYKLLSIAEEIVLNKEDYKIILLSGPSSSGKTTTAMKLELYLKSLGLNPTHLSMDDYFIDREKTPLGPDGKPDFESLKAIDTKLFENQISRMLKGNKVKVPTFNFVDGKKEYKRTVELKDNDILIIEGLHALNDEILTSIPKKKKYKIYVSPLSYLRIDNDNRISMTDLRLLRRIVRDNRTRGNSPSKTLNSWQSVRNGEEKYVFPYQDNANVLFNSSLVYELSVLKVYAEPLLYTVKEDDPEYLTAQKLLELLKCVMPLPSETVPPTSILREFIGNSYFE